MGRNKAGDDRLEIKREGLRRAFIAAHGPCGLCGANRNLIITFRDPLKTKKGAIGEARSLRALKALTPEEFTVLCRRCVRARAGFYRQGSHGAGGYRLGCRCPTCRREQRLDEQLTALHHPRRPERDVTPREVLALPGGIDIVGQKG